MCLRCHPRGALLGRPFPRAFALPCLQGGATRRHALQILPGLVVATGLAGMAPTRAGALALPAPGPRDTCPVCGMFVAPYRYWIATVLWRDGTAVHFDGAKDFFKYLLDLRKYAPRRSRAEVQALGVTDYYGGARIEAQGAHYVVGSDVLGPMGHELVPHASAEEAREFMGDHRGRRVLRFDGVTPALLAALDEGRFSP